MKNGLQTVIKCVAAFILLHCIIIATATAQYHRFVDPLIGSEGEGNVFIGPSRPFGMIKPGPDCNKGANSGYSPDSTKPVYGFSQVHVSGTGGGPKYGNISVMPFDGSDEVVKQESLRANETVSLGYYSVQLKKWNIKTEITAAHKVAYYRFEFAGNKKAVKIDAGEFLGETNIPDGREAQQFVGSEIEVVSDHEIRGYSKIRGGWNNGAAYTVYFSAVFKTPFSRFSSFKNGQLFVGQKVQVDDGKKTGALLFFDQPATDALEMKIGISFISTLKARQNIDAEVPEWDFNQCLNETTQKWEALLNKIEIDADASAAQKKNVLYRALSYHADACGPQRRKSFMGKQWSLLR